MLLKVALVLLATWVVGVVGVYDVGSLVHLLLLCGLMLLLLAFVRARDSVRAVATGSASSSRKE